MRVGYASAPLAFLVITLALGVPIPADAQFGSNCTVSVLNRTARVQTNGGWVIPNVPANFARLRARATCVGVDTRPGQSELFIVPVNASVDVGAIDVGAADPIPSSLTITTPATTLSAVGTTTQLVAAARFPDGTTQDVSAAAKGTSQSE
jgi:hypothetical protein